MSHVMPNEEPTPERKPTLEELVAETRVRYPTFVVLQEGVLADPYARTLDAAIGRTAAASVRAGDVVLTDPTRFVHLGELRL